MNVLLAYQGSSDGEGGYFESLLPVGLASLHAEAIRAGHRSRLANFTGRPPEAIARSLRSHIPGVVGISSFTFNASPTEALVRLVRRVLPSATIVLGGPHASHLPRAVMEAWPEVDVVVLGEGEATFLRLLQALSRGEDLHSIRGLVFRGPKGVTVTGWPDPIQDLDALALPCVVDGLDGVDPREQFAYVITSRGCPARCTFCNTPKFWGNRIRFRSVDSILEELRWLRRHLGLIYVSFRDDTFTVHKKRVLELCERLEESGLYFLWDCQSRVNAVDWDRLAAMRRAGCLHVQYGVESGSPRMLQRLNKDIRLDQVESAARWTRRAGLVLSVYLMHGVEDETEQDAEATLELLRRIRPHDAMVSPLAVYPGTSLWEDRLRSGSEPENAWVRPPRGMVVVGERNALAARGARRLGEFLERTAPANAYQIEDYRAQRRRVGDAFAIDLQEAELLWSAGATEEAWRLLDRRLRRQPDNPWVHRLCAEIAWSVGDPLRALEHVDAFIGCVPASPEGYQRRAEILAALDRPDEAREARLRARRLGRVGVRRTLGAARASAPVGPRPSRRARYLED